MRRFAPGTPLDVSLRWRRGDEREVGRLARRDRRIFFEFDPDFLARPLPLSPLNLPVEPGVHEERERVFDGLHGVFDDCLPDTWGRLLIDRRARAAGVRPAELGPLERLACVGDTGIGALVYAPAFETDAVDGALDLDRLAADARRVIDGEPEEVLDTLIRLGGSPGGTRPKILVERAPDGRLYSGVEEPRDDHEPLLVKFAAPSDPEDIGPLEEAYARMARAAGVELPPSRLIERGSGPPCFAIRRFDRVEGGRLHMHTLAGLLHADHTLPALDYDHVLRATLHLTRDERQVVEAWRRACFNVLAHNRDDHGKQFSFAMDATGTWRLAPAYDLTFSEGPGGDHATTVEGEGRAPTRAQLLALARRFYLRDVESVFAEVADAVTRWPDFAAEVGLSRATTAAVAARLG